MLNKLISAVNWLLSQNWREVYRYTHTGVTVIGNLMGSTFVAEKAKLVDDELNRILGKLPPEECQKVAKELSVENKLIPGVDVQWDEKKGFSVKTKLEF